MMIAVLNRSMNRTGKTDINKKFYSGDDKKDAIFSQILTNISWNLCNNSDQTFVFKSSKFPRSLGKF